MSSLLISAIVLVCVLGGDGVCARRRRAPGCIFLIVEMDGAFEGMIAISSAPMRSALAHMTP